jgi:hypothetical protein
MIPARIRSLLAATAVAAVLAHGVSGHGLSQMSHDGMASAAVGLCLLLVTVVPYVVTRRSERAASPVVVESQLRQEASAPPTFPLDARARASPPALQRFRN